MGQARPDQFRNLTLSGRVLEHSIDSVMPLAMDAQAFSVAVRIACGLVVADAIAQLVMRRYVMQTSTR